MAKFLLLFIIVSAFAVNVLYAGGPSIDISYYSSDYSSDYSIYYSSVEDCMPVEKLSNLSEEAKIYLKEALNWSDSNLSGERIVAAFKEALNSDKLTEADKQIIKDILAHKDNDINLKSWLKGCRRKIKDAIADKCDPAYSLRKLSPNTRNKLKGRIGNYGDENVVRDAFDVVLKELTRDEEADKKILQAMKSAFKAKDKNWWKDCGGQIEKFLK